MFSPEEYLATLSEEQLRYVVLIPLLRSLGLSDVIEYHGGSAEKGKDIIGHYLGLLGDRRYIAIVAKVGDIHGSASKRGNAFEVLMQAEQALNEPYTDIYDLKEVMMDECWIVTSGEIKNTAVESIRGTLAKSNLDKLVRFVDQRRLVHLISTHIPTFWYHDRLALQFLHELKSPLVAVLNTLSMMEYRGPKLTEKRRMEMVARGRADIEAALHQVETFATMQQQQRHLHKEQFRLGELLSRAVQGFDPVDRERIKVDNGLIAQVPPLLGDRIKLLHALRSVVDNAIKYSKGDVQIGVKFDSTQRRVILLVRDDGIGVPKADEVRIFDASYKASNGIQVRAGGLGMGLAVARENLRLHGGDVVLAHSPSPTVFEIDIPLEEK